MSDTTLCWNCSKSYGFADAECPHCGAVNANHALEDAQDQSAQFLGMSDDEEPMACYFIPGDL